VTGLDRRTRVRDDVRNRLLAAAWDLFSEVSFDEVTMRAIASRAGYSVRTLYLYFADKDALWGAVVEEAYRRTLESQGRPPGTEDPLGFLGAQVVRHVTEGLGRPRLYEAVSAYLGRPGIVRGEYRREVEARIQGTLVGLGADPDLAARVPVFLRAFTLDLLKAGCRPEDPQTLLKTEAFAGFVFRGLGILLA
jgi:AcrR family transcriptional regulator